MKKALFPLLAHTALVSTNLLKIEAVTNWAYFQTGINAAARSLFHETAAK